jgi:hypothetical protein
MGLGEGKNATNGKIDYPPIIHHQTILKIHELLKLSARDAIKRGL